MTTAAPGATNTTNTRTTKCPKSIIVIGAGMAGIKLAYDCFEYDNDIDVTIVEANDYIGGRMRNTNFRGHTVETGANWISGLETAYVNPVWKLAQDVNLNGHRVDDRTTAQNLMAVDEKGNDIIKDYLQSTEKFDTIYEKAMEECQKRGITPQSDVDIRTFIKDLGWGNDELTAVEKLVEYNLLEVWLTDGLETTSVAHNFEAGANDVELGKDEFFVEDSRGFNCILESMVNSIKERRGGNILLSTRVKKVNYSSSNTTNNNNKGGSVSVIIENLNTGEIKELHADVVVCTVSLGVLQSDFIEFVPPLPNWKRKALNEMQMFLFSKVYAEFHPKLVSNYLKKKNQITFCTNNKGNIHYPLWMKYRNAKINNLFMCYIGGKEARRVESLSIEEIKNEIETLFRNAFFVPQEEDTIMEENNDDDEDDNIFRPIDVYVTDWSKNPNFCGSYSVYPVHAYATIPHDHLRKGLTSSTINDDDKEEDVILYFAGEAYDDKFNGWVQGAYRSGERVAKQVMGITTTTSLTKVYKESNIFKLICPDNL